MMAIADWAPEGPKTDILDLHASATVGPEFPNRRSCR